MLTYRIHAFLIIFFFSISFLGFAYLTYNAYLEEDVNVVCSEEVSEKDCDEYKEILRSLNR